jgi:hypothetical protein
MWAFRSLRMHGGQPTNKPTFNYLNRFRLNSISLSCITVINTSIEDSIFASAWAKQHFNLTCPSLKVNWSITNCYVVLFKCQSWCLSTKTNKVCRSAKSVKCSKSTKTQRARIFKVLEILNTQFYNLKSTSRQSSSHKNKVKSLWWKSTVARNLRNKSNQWQRLQWRTWFPWTLDSVTTDYALHCPRP